MKKLRKIPNSCAVLALHYVSGKDEETTLRVCKLHEFYPDYGMDDENWREAAKDLGVETRALPISPQRLRKFLRDNPTGLFLIGTHDHLFVIDNGTIIDPRCTKPPGLGRVVKQVWRVCKTQ